MPESRTERGAYDLVAEGVGPGINGPLVVAVDAERDPHSPRESEEDVLLPRDGRHEVVERPRRQDGIVGDEDSR